QDQALQEARGPGPQETEEGAARAATAVPTARLPLRVEEARLRGADAQAGRRLPGRRAARDPAAREGAQARAVEEEGRPRVRRACGERPAPPAGDRALSRTRLSAERQAVL